MNYYPPVQMCNNDYYEKSNQNILDYHIQNNIDPNRQVYQGPLQDQQFNICQKKKTVMNKEIESFNSDLYKQVDTLVDVDSKLNNLNVIYNKCDYNPNLRDAIYVPCNKSRIKCICGYKFPKDSPTSFERNGRPVSCVAPTSAGNSNETSKSYYNNPWLNFAQINSLSKDNVDRLRYYDSCNTIPFLLNKVSVKKPVNKTQNQNKLSCKPYFNKNTKNRKTIFP